MYLSQYPFQKCENFFDNFFTVFDDSVASLKVVEKVFEWMSKFNQFATSISNKSRKRKGERERTKMRSYFRQRTKILVHIKRERERRST
jgi:CO dehydrogenase nickel-insertion accessory protein CooC1